MEAKIDLKWPNGFLKRTKIWKVYNSDKKQQTNLNLSSVSPDRLTEQVKCYLGKTMWQSTEHWTNQMKRHCIQQNWPLVCSNHSYMYQYFFWKSFSFMNKGYQVCNLQFKKCTWDVTPYLTKCCRRYLSWWAKTFSIIARMLMGGFGKYSNQWAPQLTVKKKQIVPVFQYVISPVCKTYQVQYMWQLVCLRIFFPWMGV